MNRYIFILVLLLLAGCSEVRHNSPEEAVKQFTQANYKDEAHIFGTNSFKGKILVFYKLQENICLQWVQQKKGGFIVENNPFLYKLSSNRYYDVFSLYDKTSFGYEYSAIGIIIKDTRVIRVDVHFTNGKVANAYLPNSRGFVEIFDGNVRINNIILYDKNDETIKVER